jgi:uncharacterized protein YgiM (DUF1202 family)
VELTLYFFSKIIKKDKKNKNNNFTPANTNKKISEKNEKLKKRRLLSLNSITKYHFNDIFGKKDSVKFFSLTEPNRIKNEFEFFQYFNFSSFLVF